MEMLRDIRNIVAGKDVTAERRLRKRRAFLRRHPPPGSAISWDKFYSCRPPNGGVTDTNGWRDGLIPPRYGDKETMNAFWQGYNQHLGARSRRVEDNLYHIGTIGQIMDQPTGSKPCPGGAEFVAPFKDPMNMTKKDLYRFRMWAGELPIEPWILEADVALYGKPLKAWWGGPYGTLPPGYKESRKPDGNPYLKPRQVAATPMRHPLGEPFRSKVQDPKWWKAMKDGLKKGAVTKPALVPSERPQLIMPHIKAVGPERAYKPGREWETEGTARDGRKDLSAAERSLARKERRQRAADLVRQEDGRGAFQMGGKKGEGQRRKRSSRDPRSEPRFMNQGAWYHSGPSRRSTSAVPPWVSGSYGMATGGGMRTGGAISMYQEGPGGWQGAYVGASSSSYGGSYGGNYGGRYGERNGNKYGPRPNRTNQNRNEGPRPGGSRPNKSKGSIFPSTLSSSAKPPPIQRGVESSSQPTPTDKTRGKSKAPQPPRSPSPSPKTKKKAPKPRPVSLSPSPSPPPPKPKGKGKAKEKQKPPKKGKPPPEPEPSPEEEEEAVPESGDESDYDSEEHPPSCTTCGGDSSEDDAEEDDKPPQFSRASSPAKSTKTYAAGHDSECSTCGGEDSDEDEPPQKPTKSKKPNT